LSPKPIAKRICVLLGAREIILCGIEVKVVVYPSSSMTDKVELFELFGEL
jgi:hypothetical protein